MLLGGIVSMLIVVYGWKPYFLFKYALHIPIQTYIRGFVGLFLCTIIGAVIFYVLHNTIDSHLPRSSWIGLICYAICTGAILSVIQFFILYIGSRGMRDFVARILHKC